MNRRFLTILSLMSVLCAVVLKAQTPLENYKAKYPDESVVYLDHRTDLFIDIVDGELEVLSDIYERRLFLDNLGSSYSKEEISFSGFYEVSDIEAYTQIPNGKRYKKAKVTEFSEKDELSNEIFHDDIKTINFYYPELQAGAITNLKYREAIKEPRFINSFFFGNFIPIEHAAYTIVCDENVELEVKYFHTSAEELNFKKSSRKGKTTYSWTLDDIKDWDREAGAPPVRSFLPHVLVYIKSYTADGEKKNILNDVGDLHGWYQNFLSELNQEEDEQLRVVVDSLTQHSNTELEKVRNIYYWVQDHIKYIAKEDGLGGFIPAEATQVYQSRYGDCKGMSSIMNEMLGMAGVNSHLTWVGTRDIPYRYEEVPTPVVDNHMIVTYQADDRLYFLDATGSFSPLGLPSAFIQGKEALVDMGSEYKVVEVPQVASVENTNVDSVKLRLEGSKLLGEGAAHFSGFYKVQVSERMHYQTEKERKKYLNALMEKGNNKFLISDYSLDALRDRDKALQVNYNFTIDDYAFENDDEWYVNLNLEKLLKEQEIKKDRKQGIKNRFEYEQNIVVSLDIPEAYELNYLPESNAFDHELFGYRMDYRREEDKVLMDLKIYEKYLLLEPEHFENWNKMIKQLKKNYKEVLILKKRSDNK